MDKNKVMIIGAGPMGVEYAKVLKSLEIVPTVLGRGIASAEFFKSETGINVFLGDINDWLASTKSPLPDNIIVAVNEKSIGSVTAKVIACGAKKILVEKPGGYDLGDITTVANLAKEHDSKVFVGYNRRFYASTLSAKKMIEEDGGVTSFNFEFTEWAHMIAPLKKEDGVKEQWFLSNSTHVIDLAFYLGGLPTEITCYSEGSLPWHPMASIFSGAGRTDNGALFSYQANWEAPGRWGVEILTRKRRIYLRPLEKISVQHIGSVEIEDIQIIDKLDKEFKPGIYLQTTEFLNIGNSSIVLLDIKNQLKMLSLYSKIRGDKTNY